MTLRRSAVVALSMLALSACGSSPEPVFDTPEPTAPSSVAPVPGLSLAQDQLADLVLQFRTEYPALSDGRTDAGILQGFVATCRALQIPPVTVEQGPGASDPGTVLANAALQSFVATDARQPLPSISDAAGLGRLAQQRVCGSLDGS